MKPRVYSLVWTNITTGAKNRAWHVEFDSDCCPDGDHRDDVRLKSFTSALGFAYHIAKGGNRWEFVA